MVSGFWSSIFHKVTRFQFNSIYFSSRLIAHGKIVQYRIIKTTKKKIGTKIHVATYAISQTEMIANICHYGAWHKPADCYYHEENIIANTLVYE